MAARQPKFTRLEIAGGIASGKTTLARILKRAGATCLLEDFRRNPFVRAFYQTPKVFAFETEVSFVLQHFHALKMHRTPDTIVVLDHSFFLDEAYADVTLLSTERRAFQAIVNEIRYQTGDNALVVHLECPASVALERLRARKRTMEQGIRKAYLERLNAALDRRLSKLSAQRIFRIDSGRLDYAHDEATRRAICGALMRWLGKDPYCK